MAGNGNDQLGDRNSGDPDVDSSSGEDGPSNEIVPLTTADAHPAPSTSAPAAEGPTRQQLLDAAEWASPERDRWRRIAQFFIDCLADVLKDNAAAYPDIQSVIDGELFEIIKVRKIGGPIDFDNRIEGVVVLCAEIPNVARAEVQAFLTQRLGFAVWQAPIPPEKRESDAYIPINFTVPTEFALDVKDCKYATPAAAMIASKLSAVVPAEGEDES